MADRRTSNNLALYENFLRGTMERNIEYPENHIEYVNHISNGREYNQHLSAQREYALERYWKIQYYGYSSVIHGVEDRNIYGAYRASPAVNKSPSNGGNLQKYVVPQRPASGKRPSEVGKNDRFKKGTRVIVLKAPELQAFGLTQLVHRQGTVLVEPQVSGYRLCKVVLDQESTSHEIPVVALEVENHLQVRVEDLYAKVKKLEMELSVAKTADPSSLTFIQAKLAAMKAEHAKQSLALQYSK